MNKVILVGRMTADAELRQTQSGVAVASFDIAVDRFAKQGEEKKADFFKIVAWNKTAEVISKYGEKGRKILVEGRMENRSWEDKSGNKRITTEVIAERIEFMSPSSTYQASNTAGQPPTVQASSSLPRPSAPPPRPAQPAQMSFDDFSDEDLPF